MGLFGQASPASKMARFSSVISWDPPGNKHKLEVTWPNSLVQHLRIPGSKVVASLQSSDASFLESDWQHQALGIRRGLMYHSTGLPPWGVEIKIQWQWLNRSQQVGKKEGSRLKAVILAGTIRSVWVQNKGFLAKTWFFSLQPINVHALSKTGFSDPTCGFRPLGNTTNWSPTRWRCLKNAICNSLTKIAIQLLHYCKYRQYPPPSFSHFTSPSSIVSMLYTNVLPTLCHLWLQDRGWASLKTILALDT